MDKGFLFEVIRYPIVTEKSSQQMADNKITFKVSPFANKDTIKNAVENIFSVKVSSINVFNKKGKIKVFRGHKGQRDNQKYAIVTLEKGQNIDLGIGA